MTLIMNEHSHFLLDFNDSMGTYSSHNDDHMGEYSSSAEALQTLSDDYAIGSTGMMYCKCSQPSSGPVYCSGSGIRMKACRFKVNDGRGMRSIAIVCALISAVLIAGYLLFVCGICFCRPSRSVQPVLDEDEFNVEETL